MRISKEVIEMNFAEATKKFYSVLTQEQRREYVKLFNLKQTDLITFVTQVLAENQAIKDAEEEKKQVIARKAVEESASQRIKAKDELLDLINDRLIDLSMDESWWIRLRSFFAENCGSKSTQLVVLVLSRIDEKKWQVTSLVSPNKEKRVVIDIGDEKA